MFCPYCAHLHCTFNRFKLSCQDKMSGAEEKQILTRISLLWMKDHYPKFPCGLFSIYSIMDFFCNRFLVCLYFEICAAGNINEYNGLKKAGPNKVKKFMLKDTNY